MNRRLFLQMPLVAAIASQLKAAAPEPDRPLKGFKVAAKEDRYAEELMIMGGRFDCMVSGRDTGNDLLIYDTVRDTKGGPALHRHFRQDEWFYVIRGEFIARVGDETFSLQPGDSAFLPRTIPHAFAMTSEGQGQMLVLFQPAGSMEDFFKQMSGFGSGITKNQEVVMKQLFADHGMEALGPPLKY